MSRSVTWHHYRFTSFQREGLDPWGSEPPGGMFLPGPAQLSLPKPFLEPSPTAVDEPKSLQGCRAWSPVLHLGYNPQPPGSLIPRFLCTLPSMPIPWATFHALLPSFQHPASQRAPLHHHAAKCNYQGRQESPRSKVAVCGSWATWHQPGSLGRCAQLLVLNLPAKQSLPSVQLVLTFN